MKNKILFALLLLGACSPQEGSPFEEKDVVPFEWKYLSYGDIPFKLKMPLQSNSVAHKYEKNAVIFYTSNPLSDTNWPGYFSFDIYSYPNTKNLEAYLFEYCELHNKASTYIQKVNNEMNVFYIENCSEIPKTATWPIYTLDQYVIETLSGVYAIRMTLEDYKPIHGESMRTVMTHVKPAR